jgi:starch-binding outer membrane protein, SusD/RagB family
MKIVKYFIVPVLFVLSGCSDLQEKLNDGLNESASAEPQQLLTGAYSSLRDLLNQDNLFALTVHPTDEAAGPTRGRDWDDAGAWRVLHTHSWTTAHPHINNVWRILNRNAFNAQQVVCGGGSGSIAAEATFLKVFNEFLVLDLFGQIPRRQCNENLLNPPSQLLTREEAITTLISELEASLADLPATGTAGKATKNSARALLCKLYLNKAVYLATDAAGGAQVGPYTFAAADMNKVIQYADEIAASGQYDLDDNYFDNFIPDNGTESSELIFVIENTSGAGAGNVRSRWFSTLHYNMNPSGWNGFVGLTDLYNRFEASDKRLSSDSIFLSEPIADKGNSREGIRAGLLVGQQYNNSNDPTKFAALKDRTGAPLIFTPEFSLLETGSNLEVTGIRVVKYPPDFTTAGDAADNDYVLLRFADVRLMKAEAILRGGTSNETPLFIVNELRTIRGASTLGTVTEQILSDERSRELYWEGWRRNDQIRFGSFLGTCQEKNTTSTAERLLFPIPAEAVSLNPNLVQNPGY